MSGTASGVAKDARGEGHRLRVAEGGSVIKWKQRWMTMEVTRVAAVVLILRNATFLLKQGHGFRGAID